MMYPSRACDAELDPLGLGYLRVLVSHAGGTSDQAIRGIDGLAKFAQPYRRRWSWGDGGRMSGDGGVDKQFSESLQLRQRAFQSSAPNQSGLITGDIAARMQPSVARSTWLAAQDATRGLGTLDSIIAAS